MEYAFLVKVRGGMEMRASRAPGGRATRERLRDEKSPGRSMTSSTCGCEGWVQLGVRRAILTNQIEVDSFQIAYVGFRRKSDEGKTADSQEKQHFTHLIVYILSASCMPTTARHFPNCGEIKWT